MTALTVQFFIFLMIIVSVSFVVIETTHHGLFIRYEHLFINIEYVILAVFSAEFVLRYIAAPSKKKFFKDPLTLITATKSEVAL